MKVSEASHSLLPAWPQRMYEDTQLLQININETKIKNKNEDEELKSIEFLLNDSLIKLSDRYQAIFDNLQKESNEENNEINNSNEEFQINFLNEIHVDDIINLRSLASTSPSYSTLRVFDWIFIAGSNYTDRYVRIKTYDNILKLMASIPSLDYLSKIRLNYEEINLSTSSPLFIKELLGIILCGQDDPWPETRLLSLQSLSHFLTHLFRKYPSFSDSFPYLRLAPSFTLLSTTDLMIIYSHFIYQVIPTLCLNRYFPAQAIQSHAQNIWMDFFVDKQYGREILLKDRENVVEYYFSMLSSTSHLICEASLFAIAEYFTKLDYDTVKVNSNQALL